MAGSVAFGFSGFGESVEIVGMVAPLLLWGKYQEKEIDMEFV